MRLECIQVSKWVHNAQAAVTDFTPSNSRDVGIEVLPFCILVAQMVDIGARYLQP